MRYLFFYTKTYANKLWFGKNCWGLDCSVLKWHCECGAAARGNAYTTEHVESHWKPIVTITTGWAMASAWTPPLCRAAVGAGEALAVRLTALLQHDVPTAGSCLLQPTIPLDSDNSINPVCSWLRHGTARLGAATSLQYKIRTVLPETYHSRNRHYNCCLVNVSPSILYLQTQPTTRRSTLPYILLIYILLNRKHIFLNFTLFTCFECLVDYYNT